MSDAPTRCIECGGTVGFLNEDDNGAPCPACAMRLLETLPGVFHAPWGVEATAEDESVTEAAAEALDGSDGLADESYGD